MNLVFPRQNVEKYSNIKLNEKPTTASRVVACGRKKICDVVNNCDLQFCESAYCHRTVFGQPCCWINLDRYFSNRVSLNIVRVSARNGGINTYKPILNTTKIIKEPLNSENIFSGRWKYWSNLCAQKTVPLHIYFVFCRQEFLGIRTIIQDFLYEKSSRSTDFDYGN
jgi:hypothetical protein